MLALPCDALTAEQRLEFDIAGGPLSAVLLEIAQTGGAVVSFNPSLVERCQAPAVRGPYTLTEALTQATRSCGLVVETTAAGVLTLAELPAATPASRRPPAPRRPARPVLRRAIRPRYCRAWWCWGRLTRRRKMA